MRIVKLPSAKAEDSLLLVKRWLYPILKKKLEIPSNISPGDEQSPFSQDLLQTNFELTMADRFYFLAIGKHNSRILLGRLTTTFRSYFFALVAWENPFQPDSPAMGSLTFTKLPWFFYSFTACLCNPQLIYDILLSDNYILEKPSQSYYPRPGTKRVHKTYRVLTLRQSCLRTIFKERITVKPNQLPTNLVQDIHNFKRLMRWLSDQFPKSNFVLRAGPYWVASLCP